MKEFLQRAKSYSEANGTLDCRTLLDEFIRSGELCRRLKSLLNDPAALSEIARNSNFHTNHFAKIVLTRFEGWNLRVHDWPVETYEQIHEPHSHRWSFTSHVLRGTMVNQIITEQAGGEPHDKYIAHATVISEMRPYDFVGTFGLGTFERQIHEAGTSYVHPVDVVHIARIPAHAHTTTLFLTSPPQKDSSFIYMPKEVPPPGDVPLMPLEPKQIADVIQSLVSIFN